MSRSDFKTKREYHSANRFTGVPGGTIISKPGGLDPKICEEFNRTRLDRWKKWLKDRIERKNAE